MNLALYREFRPKSFDEVVGQDFIVQTLKNQIKTNRLTHAYLFCGPRGTGKTSTAKIFAKAVNCTHSEDGNPCDMCAECVALSQPNTDIIEIDAASNNRVEEIRDLREKVNFPPVIGKYKVYIIDEVHMLTDSAFNALLKTLEEPPKHIIFILATTEIHKLPATILSRCTRFDFKLLDINTLSQHLKNIFDKKHITYDEKSLHLLAKAGEGSVRDMLSIADSVASFCDYHIDYQSCEKIIGLSGKESIKDILSAILNKDIKSLFEGVNSALEQGKNIQVFCKEMADFVRNMIMVKVGVDDYASLDFLPGEYSSMVEFANQFDLNFLKTAFSKFSQLELNLKYSLNPENLFESACLELITVAEPANLNKENNFSKNEKKSAKIEEKSENLTQKSQNFEKNEEDLNNFQTSDLAPKTKSNQTEIERVWGNVLLKVKEKNLFAFSNALESVIKVEKIGEKLLIHSNDSASRDLIDNPERIEILLKIINLFDDSIKTIQVEYDRDNASSKDIKDNLKEIFKSKIKFKE